MKTPWMMRMSKTRSIHERSEAYDKLVFRAEEEMDRAEDLKDVYLDMLNERARDYNYYAAKYYEREQTFKTARRTYWLAFVRAAFWGFLAVFVPHKALETEEA